MQSPNIAFKFQKYVKNQTLGYLRQFVYLDDFLEDRGKMLRKK